MSTHWGPGYHGKLPSRGDFVAFGLPREFAEPWDAWLSMALTAAQAVLGPAWEGLFAAAPPWRFALAAGVCGPAAVAGVLVASRDRVGRAYPFVIAAATPRGVETAAVPAGCRPWFERAERLAATAARAATDLHTLPARAAAIGRPEAAPGPAHRAVVESHLGPLPGTPSLWWTAGGGRVEASLLTCPGLPDGLRFAAMLDNAWERRGWETAEVSAPVP